MIFLRDVGPSRSLAIIASEAINKGHNVAFSTLNGVLLDDAVIYANDYDVVLMSSGTLHTDKDADIIRALKKNSKKVAYFSDTYGVCARPEILLVAHLCDFAFVVDIFEKAKAVEAGFKNVVVSGVPLWEEFCKTSRYTSDDIRLSLGIPKSPKTILFTGIKKSGIVKRAFGDLLWVISRLNGDWFLLPRFRKEDEFFEEGYYENVLRSRGFSFAYSHNLYDNIGDLLPAVDLVISLASTVGIEAIYKRKRVIDYLPDYFIERLKEIGGGATWDPAELGATKKADSKESLEQAINYLFTDDGFAELRKNQEKFYPIIKGNNAAKIILETLEREITPA